MSRRRPALRLETFEDRTVPAVSLGTIITGGSGSSFAPPDTDGAVGPNHYVQFINGRFAVYNKTTGSPISAVSDTTFWNAANISTSLTNQGLSDPRIIYDPLSGHWFVCEINTSNTGNSILVGRSNTNDPTAGAGWKATSYILNSSNFADYPTLAVDFNAVYIGIDDFPAAGAPSEAITSIPKADLLLSIPTADNRTTLEQASAAVTIGETPRGVTNFNAGQTSSSNGSIFAADYHSFGFADRTTVTGAGGPGATFGTSTQLSVQPTSFPSDAHQPDGTAQIDALDGRIQSMAYQVGDLIFGALVTTIGSRDAIRLTVMSDSGNSIVTEATISDSTFDYIDPSVAMNAEGDMIVGFTRSAAVLGSGATDGRLGAYAKFAHIDPNNPAGGITFGSVVQIQAGLANYHLIGGAGERWGDYSSTDVDPNNPTAFWTTQEYAIASNTWGTKIGQVFVSPRVSLTAGVSSTAADGSYTTGAVIPIAVTFNDAVTVAGIPQLALNAGGGAVATYASGSGTKTLTFNYTVGLGQAAADLDYTSAAALTLPGGATIKDTASNLDAILTLAAPAAAGSLGSNKNIVIDTTPRVNGGVSSTTSDGTYGTGVHIPITVTFSSPVTVTGIPQLALNAGGGAVAIYSSGTGSSVLTFDYLVGAGQAVGDLDYISTTALTLPGGATIKDSSNATINAILTLPAPGTAGSLGANKQIVIDTTNPFVSNVTSPVANGPYGFGALIPVALTFSKKVTVTGIPQLALNSGATVNYTSGSGTTTLTFNYTVALDDFALDLNYLTTSALTLPGAATIKEFGTSNDATLTLPTVGGPGSLGSNKDIGIDAHPAKALDVTSGLANGTYGWGSNITVTVTFDKTVDVTGTPLLALNTGGTAAYTSGTGTKVLTFAFTVGLTDFAPDLDYASTLPISLPGGATIQDHANPTAAANLTLPAPGTAGSLGANKDLAIDGRPAAPTDVTSASANGTYGINDVIPIAVTFSKPVVVTGSPQLALNSGGTAIYTGGNGTFTTLTFSYTVVAGDNATDLDYASASALTLNGATIQDHASNTPAPLTLPAPGAAGSLAANKNIVIDTTGPSVLEYRVKYGARWYNLIGSPRFDVPWKVTAIQVVFDEPVTTGNVQSLTGITATKLTGLGTTTLTWKVSTILKGSFATALAATGPNALADAGGNLIAPFSRAVNVLYGDFNDDQVVNGLDEAGVRANVVAPYQTGSAGYNQFADLSGDGLVNLIDVGVARGRKGKTLP